LSKNERRGKKGVYLAPGNKLRYYFLTLSPWVTDWTPKGEKVNEVVGY